MIKDAQTTIPSLDSILDQFDDPIIKARIIAKLAGKKEVPNSHISFCIETLVTTGNIVEAAKAAELFGKNEEAIKIYEENNHKLRAAELAKKLKLVDKAISLYAALHSPEDIKNVLLEDHRYAEAYAFLSSIAPQYSYRYAEAAELVVSGRVSYNKTSSMKQVLLFAAKHTEGTLLAAECYELIGQPRDAIAAYKRAIAHEELENRIKICNENNLPDEEKKELKLFVLNQSYPDRKGENSYLTMQLQELRGTLAEKLELQDLAKEALTKGYFAVMSEIETQKKQRSEDWKSYFFQAATLARKAGFIDESISAARAAESYTDAINWAIEAGQTEIAKDIGEEALLTYRRLDNQSENKKKIRVYSNIKLFKKANVSDIEKLYREAIDYFVNRGSFSLARDLAEEMQWTIEAEKYKTVAEFIDGTESE